MSVIQNIRTRVQSRVSNIRENIAGKMGMQQQLAVGQAQLLEKGKQLLSEFRSRDKQVNNLSLTTGEKLGMDFGDSRRSPKAIVQSGTLDIVV
jgi:hypothetical protein